ncbi:unnamed protein product, partial [Brassica oleracea var. botrytis]
RKFLEGGGTIDYSIGVAAIRSSSASMRPVFVGNFEYETRQSELERLFRKYGRNLLRRSMFTLIHRMLDFE